jgi:hypothetical protein
VSSASPFLYPGWRLQYLFLRPLSQVLTGRFSQGHPGELKLEKRRRLRCVTFSPKVGETPSTVRLIVPFASLLGRQTSDLNVINFVDMYWISQLPRLVLFQASRLHKHDLPNANLHSSRPLFHQFDSPEGKRPGPMRHSMRSPV